MNDDKPENKKSFPNSFIWFLLAAFLFALFVQNFLETKFAKVSFSYQLEHLVNLQLIQPEDSRKTALNDNLVTFSGRFRERKTEEGKKRFKFSELLNANHALDADLAESKEELTSLRDKIDTAASWFLYLSGTPIPATGYVVVGDIYNTPVANNSVVLHSIPERNVPDLPELGRQFATLEADPLASNGQDFGKQLLGLIRNFRSPVLGIGSEPMKQQLREMEKNVTAVDQSNATTEQKFTIYGQALQGMRAIVSELNKPEEHVRLGKLRSVRSYKEALDHFSRLHAQLQDNKAQLNKAQQSVANVIWFFNNKELSTRTLEKQDAEAYHHWFLNAKEEWDNFAQNKGGYFKAPDQPLNTVLEKTFKSEEPAPNYMNYLFTIILPIGILLLLMYFVFARQMRGVGGNAMSFGKSPAKMLTKEKNKVTFEDVAGIEEAKEELVEVVDFLKNPNKFTALGGHIPKGVLLIGPPGCGKTMIAKAVAGEADRPFFSISGSDFVEMFVGVGASRIRDMFEQAKKHAPCIIFIDEIDAVGRHRGSGIGGGHDEREQTLNQLLVEMDGFDTNEGVILMAATNRPDVLDRALLRPGRFDRRVMISLPDIKGRYEILKVHARKIKMDPAVDLMDLARATPGASGADLENVLNEAALLAARENRTAVTKEEIVEARDKVFYGKERRSLEMDEGEKRTTAYHESGHTMVSLFVEHADPVDKVTIIPRGLSLGSTMFLPTKNRVSYWKKELLDRLAVLMGGRAAEEVFIGDICSGAQQDIEQATQLARSMVCEWGMNDKLGTVMYDERSEGGQHLGMAAYHEKKYSEETARSIDEEVRLLLEEAHTKAKKIIEDNYDKVELMAKMLMEFETLDCDDVEKISAGKWDIEEKRRKLREAAEAHTETTMTPPPPPPQRQHDLTATDTPMPPPEPNTAS